MLHYIIYIRIVRLKYLYNGEKKGRKAAATFVYSLPQLCDFVHYDFFLYSSPCPPFTLYLFLCIPLYFTLRLCVLWPSPFRDATSRAYWFRWLSRPNCRRPFCLHRYSTAVPGLDSRHNRHSFLSPWRPGELQAHQAYYAVNTGRSTYIVLFYALLCCSIYIVLFYVLLCCSMYHCVVLCIIVLFYVYCFVLCITMLFYVYCVVLRILCFMYIVVLRIIVLYYVLLCC